MAHEIIDQSSCPLCGANNQCAVTQGEPAQACWCMQTNIAAEALAAIPAQLRNRACLCSRCAQGRSAQNAVQEFTPHE